MPKLPGNGSAPRKYSADVERWRPLVAKYFSPEDEDKAMWVISHESPTGKPGDGGHARGPFQIQAAGSPADPEGKSRPSRAWLDVPENNIRYAAEMVYGGSGWSPWGEGASYQGKPFGALGNYPYPGRSGAATGGSTMSPSRLTQTSPRLGLPGQLGPTVDPYKNKTAKWRTDALGKLALKHKSGHGPGAIWEDPTTGNTITEKEALNYAIANGLVDMEGNLVPRSGQSSGQPSAQSPESQAPLDALLGELSSGDSGMSFEQASTLASQIANATGQPYDRVLSQIYNMGDLYPGQRGPTPDELALGWDQNSISRYNADTSAARARADEAYQNGQLALSQGQMDIALLQFNESRKQNEIANQLEQQSMANQSRQTAIGERQTATGERGQALREIIDPANTQISGYNAMEQAAQGRAGIGARSSELLGSLFGQAGQLGLGQEQLAFDMAKSPRNAIAAFLVGQGAPAGQGRSFAPQNLLGFDPSIIQTLLGQAQQGALQGQQFAQQAPGGGMDLRSILANLGASMGRGSPGMSSGMAPDIQRAPPLFEAPRSTQRASFSNPQTGQIADWMFDSNTGKWEFSVPSRGLASPGYTA